MWIVRKGFRGKPQKKKKKSAKQKLNLINTTIEQNRTQEIVKINGKLGEKVAKP